jgi:cob(I)alamin adenosyltransferase
MVLQRGTVQVYTGDGKGKTTASLGQALRVVGHGGKVVMIQFMKGRMYGELAAADEIEGLSIEQYGRDEFVDPVNTAPVDKELAEKGWARVEELVSDESIDMLILDEINVAVFFGLIPLERVISLVENKPARLELVLTGRYAAEEIIKIADTVTEMLEVKHHFQMGIQARKGIEY